MSAPNPVLTTIIFVFAIQTILLSGLLIWKRPRNFSNVFLALLVFFYALMAFNIALVNVLSANDLFHIFRYVQLEHLFGIGPALYFYTKTITERDFHFDRKSFLHFLPVIIEFFFYRTAFYRLGADGLYETPHHPYTKIYMTEQWLGILSISIYTLWSLLLIIQYQAKLKEQYSNLESHSIAWLKIPVIIYSAYWIGWTILTEIDRFVFDRSLRESYFLPAFVGLAIVTCWIGFKGYLKSQTVSPDTPTLKTRKQSEPVNSELASQLESLMITEKVYLNPDLDLSQLADLLGVNSKQVSQTINTSFSKNFYLFVNQYRVEAFKERLKSPEQDRITLLGHALECGFKSKSTFNEVFKKTTGQTPSQYYKQVKNESG